MQSIITKYLPATNNRPSRIKAICDRGSKTVAFDHSLSGDEIHAVAVRSLLAMFCEQDLEQYKTPIESNPWNRPFVSGGLPGQAGMAHVFLQYVS
jgi:hypothetical protein